MRDLLVGRSANDVAVLVSSILLVAAAASASIGYSWSLPAIYVIAGLLVVFAFLIPRCLLIANQWERMIILRLGKLRGIRGPGPFLIIPFVDTVATSIDQRIQILQLSFLIRLPICASYLMVFRMVDVGGSRRCVGLA
ncbi:MAG: SPFH domain-containing protein [Rhodopila sp.]